MNELKRRGKKIGEHKPREKHKTQLSELFNFVDEKKKSVRLKEGNE